MTAQKNKKTTEAASPKQDQESAETKNVGMAIVAYILFFVPLLTDAKNDPFVKYHVKQGLVLLITVLIANAFMFIPILGWIIGWLISLFCLIAFILGIINAANGECKELPLIGQFAKNFKL